MVKAFKISELSSNIIPCTQTASLLSFLTNTSHRPRKTVLFAHNLNAPDFTCSRSYPVTIYEWFCLVKNSPDPSPTSTPTESDLLAIVHGFASPSPRSGVQYSDEWHLWFILFTNPFSRPTPRPTQLSDLKHLALFPARAAP
jgi:hypothetical protein